MRLVHCHFKEQKVHGWYGSNFVLYSTGGLQSLIFSKEFIIDISRNRARDDKFGINNPYVVRSNFLL